ncbi:MAG: protein kinase, partial [Acidobacteriota bacterium]
MSSQSDQNTPGPDDRVTEAVNVTGLSQTLGPGFKLNGRYMIERELGRGGIGVVYLARDERLHSMPVVIKFLLEASGQNAWLATKFLQEAEALTRINHPSVVKVIDRDTSADGRPFFVMEFVSGRALRSVMRPGGMELSQAAPIIRQIGQALAAAHQQGVVHRDLKPENILLQHLSIGEEQVKLIDFGIAKVHDSQSGAATEVSIIAGSLQYIAPEQVNSQPVSAATDIYALAIVAYEILTGKRPFETSAPGYLAAVQQLAQMQRDEQIIAPRELRPDLPERADSLIRSALSFDPHGRPQDARAFSDDLARALSDERGTSRIPVASPTGNADLTEVLSVETQKNLTPPPVDARPIAPRGLLWGVLVAVVAIVVAAVLLGIVPRLRQGSNETPVGRGQEQTVAPGELALSYSVTMQKDPQRYPGSKPFQLPGEVVFSPGDRIHLNFSSSQRGFLYIINEGPDNATGAFPYNALFPSASRAGGAEIAPGDSIRLPEKGDGFIFDNQEGVEKLWIIFSHSPISLLETVKRWANPDSAGQLRDRAEIDALRKLIAEQSQVSAIAEKNEETRQTTLRAKGPMLVRLVRMEHH